MLLSEKTKFWFCPAVIAKLDTTRPGVTTRKQKLEGVGEAELVVLGNADVGVSEGVGVMEESLTVDEVTAEDDVALLDSNEDETIEVEDVKEVAAKLLLLSVLAG